VKKHTLFLPVLLSSGLLVANAALEVSAEALYQEEIINDNAENSAATESVLSSRDVSQTDNTPIPVITPPAPAAAAAEPAKPKPMAKMPSTDTENQQKVKLVLLKLQHYLEDYFEKLDNQNKVAKKAASEKLAQTQTQAVQPLPPQPPSQQQAEIGAITPPQSPVNLPQQPIPAYGSRVPPPSAEATTTQVAPVPALTVQATPAPVQTAPAQAAPAPVPAQTLPVQAAPTVQTIQPATSPTVQTIQPATSPTVQTIQPAASPTVQTINPPQSIPSMPAPAPAPAPTPIKVEPAAPVATPHAAVTPAIPENAAQLNIEPAAVAQTENTSPSNLVVSTSDQEKNAENFAQLEAEFNKDLEHASQNPSVIENIIANTEKMKAAVLAENNVELIGPAKLTDEGLLTFDSNIEEPSRNKIFFNLIIINMLLFSVVGFVMVLWKKLRIKKITTLLDELRS
jgi:hypothetical protein